MALTVVTAAERPDLVARAWAVTRDTLPEYNNHGAVLNGRLPHIGGPSRTRGHARPA